MTTLKITWILRNEYCLLELVFFGQVVRRTVMQWFWSTKLNLKLCFRCVIHSLQYPALSNFSLVETARTVVCMI